MNFIIINNLLRNLAIDNNILFGHILRPSGQIAMDYCCTKSITILKSGTAETTLPIILFNKFHNYKQSIKKSSYRQQHKTALKELAS